MHADWVGVGKTGYNAWRRLALTARTTIDRVRVHSLHPHDSRRCDCAAKVMLDAHGLGGKMIHALDHIVAAVKRRPA